MPVIGSDNASKLLRFQLITITQVPLMCCSMLRAVRRPLQQGRRR